MSIDQQQMWDDKHAAGEHEKWSNAPRRLATKVVEDMSPGAKLLELGCGVGSDARFFASKGVDVLATDFSQIVIEQNQKRGQSKKLQFATLDIAEPFPYGDQSFDVVYAYLSLHYYPDL